MKSIAVMLKPEAARAWHAGAASPGGTEPAEMKGLKELVASLGIQLIPTHPGAQHELLLPYFNATVAADHRAEAIAEALRQSPAVEGAYVNPAPAPP